MCDRDLSRNRSVLAKVIGTCCLPPWFGRSN